MLVQTFAPESDAARRALIYSGGLLALPPNSASQRFCEFAWQLICEAFDPIEPAFAQEKLPLEQFVAIVAALKPRYTHSPVAKTLLGELIASHGCDPDQTYFDLPKLRIVTHSEFLTAGVGYAYKAHRDTWYSCPPSQNNWWLPITPIVSDCSLAFFPDYWQNPTQNSSGGFDAFEWNSNGRAGAAQHVKVDSRNHPALTKKVDLSNELRVVGAAASTLIFSAQQLHATVPNTSGQTRFSIDFRTTHIDDLRERRGANIIDSGSTGSTIYDFRRASDLSPVPDDVARLYDLDGTHRGELVYTPPTVAGAAR